MTEWGGRSSLCARRLLFCAHINRQTDWLVCISLLGDSLATVYRKPLTFSLSPFYSPYFTHSALNLKVWSFSGMSSCHKFHMYNSEYNG